MPAYNSNFIAPISFTQGGVTAQITGVTVTSNIQSIEEKEIMIAGGEIVLAGTPFDIVEQVVRVTPLILSVELTTSIGGDTVPYVPGIILPPTPPSETPLTDAGLGVANTTTQGGTKMLETYLNASAGSYIVASKKSRAWGNSLDPNAKFIVYESQDGGSSFTQRVNYAPDISRHRTLTALRASDKVYLSIYMEKAEFTTSPTIYVTKGIIGGSLGYTTYKWERPYLPVSIACDGTKFVVLTEGNRIYTSVDGAAWTYVGLLSPLFPYTLSSTLLYGSIATNYGGAIGTVALNWLPGIAKWIVSSIWGAPYLTTDINAQTGWVISSGPAPVVDGIYRTTHGAYAYRVVELDGNLYTVGTKQTVNTTTNTVTFNGSVIYKSIDQGATWVPVKEMLNSSLYGSNDEDAVLDNISIFSGYLVAYTRGSNPRRYKSLDAGATWTSEATNLLTAEAANVIVLAAKVVAIANLGVANDIYRYSTDGLVFDDSTTL